MAGWVAGKKAKTASAAAPQDAETAVTSDVGPALNGKVCTFYSYKGGVGRTFALANIAAVLTRWGYRVLCIDWDLEAPGLHLYFDNYMSQDRPKSPGLLELIQRIAGGKKADWRKYAIPRCLLSTGEGPKHQVATLPKTYAVGPFSDSDQEV